MVAKFNDNTPDRFSSEAVLDAAPSEVVSAEDSKVVAAIVKELTEESEALAVVETEPAPLNEVIVEVKPGDSLSRLFSAHDIPARDLAMLLECEPLGPRLKSIFPGHTLTFQLNDAQTLVGLRYTPGPLAEVEFERVGDGFIGREVVREPERIATYRSGTIDHSLFVASQRAGLDDALTMQLAQLFQWDIDFVLDIRAGDRFHVVYEALYLGDEFVRNGDILAAEFINQDRSYVAVMFEDAEGRRDYFEPNGASMRKAFLRAPVEFSRISSNFNMRRRHPVLNRVIPHRGIDYAAPTGTPILAAGDGRVITAARNKYNGNYLFIQHGEQYKTKYLHLSAFARGVKAGARVRQGQVIGYVGATGMVTGPHLHYEFLVDGVHRNPRTVTLPNAAPIESQSRPAFQQQSAERLAVLARYKADQSSSLVAAH